MATTRTVDTYKDGVKVSSTTVTIPDEVTNMETLYAQALAAFNTNRQAIAAPTAAVTLAQAVNQIKNLSAQNNAIMRILFNMLDGTN